MESISIINREANFNPNSIQRVNNANNIFTSDKNIEEAINKPFEKLRNSDKSISNHSDLRESVELVKKEKLAKTRVLTKPENSGFILMGSLTIVGIVGLGTLIFMAIKNFIIR